MNIYVLQVQTGFEEYYIKLLRSYMTPPSQLRMYFPKRALKERRKGKIVLRNVPVFPSYLFVEVENGDDILQYRHYFRKTDGFFKFLPSNRNVCPLQGADLSIAAHFIFQKNTTAEVSKAYFDENDRIVILEGPLLGLEGCIVKVDKRKFRAKVRLDLYNNSFAIDLSFDIIDNIR